MIVQFRSSLCPRRDVEGARGRRSLLRLRGALGQISGSKEGKSTDRRQSLQISSRSTRSARDFIWSRRTTSLCLNSHFVLSLSAIAVSVSVCVPSSVRALPHGGAGVPRVRAQREDEDGDAQVPPLRRTEAVLSAAGGKLHQIQEEKCKVRKGGIGRLLRQSCCACALPVVYLLLLRESPKVLSQTRQKFSSHFSNPSLRPLNKNAVRSLHDREHTAQSAILLRRRRQRI